MVKASICKVQAPLAFSKFDKMGVGKKDINLQHWCENINSNLIGLNYAYPNTL